MAERFAREDFRVVLVARRSEALTEYQKEFMAKGYETSTVACDVTDVESAKATFEKIRVEVGTPDVLVYIILGTHFDPALIAESYWQMYKERKDWEVRFE